MKNKILKLITLAVLSAILLAAFASCGGGTPSYKSADGTWEGFEWNYESDTKTLTVKGSGDMTSAAIPESISWYSLRAGVERIKLIAKDGNAITSIGDYCFYGMTNLKEVEIPEGVTSIGKCAFAFSFSPAAKSGSVPTCTLTLPESLTTIGEAAFESCDKLTVVKIPAGVTKLGARAFAFCDSLETVVMASSAKLERWAFKDCKTLTSLTVPAGYDISAVDSAAFEGANIGADKITLSDTIDKLATITVKYVDEDGNEMATSETYTKAIGEEFVATPKTVEGYTSPDEQRITVEKEEEVITLVYKKAEEATDVTETPTDTTPEEPKDKTSMIIALIIFAVVLGGIGVGAFLLMRSDKKAKNTSSTVRKNSNDNNSKKKK